MKLLELKKYEMSVSFFLLGGYLEDACNIIINKMEDI